MSKYTKSAMVQYILQVPPPPPLFLKKCVNMTKLFLDENSEVDEDIETDEDAEEEEEEGTHDDDTEDRS